MIAQFTLREQYALGGQYTWRLKESELRFRGEGRFKGMVNQRIPAGDERVSEFVDVLNLLEVWKWRSNYSPSELGFEVLDGSAWWFSANCGSLQVECGGENAYPSFADPSLSSTSRGRFACLSAALYACFDIDTYIHIAAHQRRMEMENDKG